MPAKRRAPEGSLRAGEWDCVREDVKKVTECDSHNLIEVGKGCCCGWRPPCIGVIEVGTPQTETGSVCSTSDWREGWVTLR